MCFFLIEIHYVKKETKLNKEKNIKLSKKILIACCCTINSIGYPFLWWYLEQISLQPSNSIFFKHLCMLFYCLRIVIVNLKCLISLAIFFNNNQIFNTSKNKSETLKFIKNRITKTYNNLTQDEINKIINNFTNTWNFDKQLQCSSHGKNKVNYLNVIIEENNQRCYERYCNTEHSE